MSVVLMKNTRITTKIISMIFHSFSSALWLNHKNIVHRICRKAIVYNITSTVHIEGESHWRANGMSLYAGGRILFSFIFYHFVLVFIKAYCIRT